MGLVPHFNVLFIAPVRERVGQGGIDKSDAVAMEVSAKSALSESSHGHGHGKACRRYSAAESIRLRKGGSLSRYPRRIGH